MTERASNDSLSSAWNDVHPIIRDDIMIMTDNPVFSKLKPGNVFIAGISGLIGSYLALALLMANERYALGLKITGASRNSGIFAKQFPGMAIRLIDHDVKEEINFTEPFTYVVQAASPIGSRAFTRNPVEALSVNTIGTLNLLRAASENATCRFLFISSIEVYGSAEGVLKEDAPVEINAASPRSCYPVGKIAGENACACFHKQFGTDTVIARLSRVYGPGMNLSCGLFICDFVRDIIDKKEIILTGDGLVRRQICYVTDIVCGLVYVLTAGCSGGIYNIAPHDSAKVVDIAAILAERSGKVPVKHSPPLEIIEYSTAAKDARQDISALMRLGWSPGTSLENGINRLVSYYDISAAHEQRGEKEKQ